MKKLMGVMALGCLMAAGAMAETWTGFISDSMCGAKHAAGTPADAKCAQACVKNHGASPVLVSDGKVIPFTADSQSKVADLVGKKVTITGTMSDGSLNIEEAKAAE